MVHLLPFPGIKILHKGVALGSAVELKWLPSSRDILIGEMQYLMPLMSCTYLVVANDFPNSIQLSATTLVLPRLRS